MCMLIIIGIGSETIPAPGRLRQITGIAEVDNSKVR